MNRTRKPARDIRKGDRIALIKGSDHFTKVTFTRKIGNGAWKGWYKIQYMQPNNPGGIGEDIFRGGDEIDVALDNQAANG